jgi:hypothetical protein
MPCLVVLFAFFMPRALLFFLYSTSQFMDRAFGSWITVALGVLFMPYTTLAYATSINWHGEVSEGYAILVLVAVLLDFGIIRSSIKPRFLGL